MTRKEAIGNLKHAIRWNDMPKKEALDMAIKAFEQTRWIPVSERLPDIPDGENWVSCLCYGEKEITPDHVDDPNTITCIEIVTYFRCYGWDGWFHPIAWMPLPGPYNVESEK